MMQADERTERIRRLSRAIKDNALTGADLLSLAVQASAKKQLQRHDYPLSAQKSAVKSASKFVSGESRALRLVRAAADRDAM